MDNYLVYGLWVYTTESFDREVERLEGSYKEAIDLGADEVISVRFMTSMVMQGASEMLVYGTAVKLK